MDWMDVEISLDLVSAARKHLHFLDNIDNVEKLLNKDDLLEHAVRRYEQLWFPLVDEYRPNQIVAPIDIAWMWYCHMLRPLAYRRDCRRILRRTLNHSFIKSHDIIESTNNAIEVWYEKYPRDGFNTIRNGEYIKPSRKMGKITDATSRLSVELTEIAKAQINFCYQVALPHFRDKQFLETALRRYKQFLCLKRLNPDAFLTPPVDILLIWFTHMCYPVEYATDTMKACGRVLENNVRIQIGTIIEKFRSASHETHQRWTSVSKEALFQPGTKLRTRDTKLNIKDMILEDLKSCCVVVYKLAFSHAELVGLETKMQRFRVRLNQEHFDSSTDEVLILKGSKRQRLWNFKTTVSYVTSVHSGLRVSLTEDSKLLCLKGENTFASGTLKLTPILESMRVEEKPISLTIEMDSQTDGSKLRVLLDGRIEDAQPITCNLTLINPEQEFTDTVIGVEQLQQTFGRSTLAENRRNHRCFYRTVKMRNHEGEECFSCRVTHVPDQLLSGIQVFFYDTLMATSYVIGSSQLPLPTQVARSDLSMAFDPEIGERAMLIRNSKGDWGLCIGRWTKDGSAEFLKIRFMRLTKVKLKTLEVDTVDLHFQSFYANLHTGTISIDPSNNMICENIALIFTISVLHVLCAPEDTDRRMKSTLGKKAFELSDTNLSAWTYAHNECPVASQQNAVETQSITLEATVPEAECALLLAAGLKTTTPNNKYILEQYGSLSVDLSFDAQDIFIEEIKVERSLFKKDSKLSKYDIQDSPRRLKRKKHSKLADGNKDVLKNSVSEPNTNTTEATKASSEKVKKETKAKKIRKRRSTKLEDAMCPSDDSLDLDLKEQMQFLQKNGNEQIVVIESVATAKLLQKKKSSALEEELSPSEDSLDDAEKEWKEFKDTETVITPTTENGLTNEISTQDQTSSVPNVLSDKESIVKYSSNENNAQSKEEKPVKQPEQNSDWVSNQTYDKHLSSVKELRATTDENTDPIKKQSTETRQKSLSRSHAVMLSDDSQDSGTLTPVEADIPKRRKRRRRVSFDKGNTNNVAPVQTAKDSKSHDNKPDINEPDIGKEDKKAQFYI